MVLLYPALLASSNLEWKSKYLLASLHKNTREITWRQRTEEKSRDNRNRHGNQEQGGVFSMYCFHCFCREGDTQHAQVIQQDLLRLNQGRLHVKGKGYHSRSSILCFPLNLKNYLFLNLKTQKNNFFLTVMIYAQTNIFGEVESWYKFQHLYYQIYSIQVIDKLT